MRHVFECGIVGESEDPQGAVFLAHIAAAEQRDRRKREALESFDLETAVGIRIPHVVNRSFEIEITDSALLRCATFSQATFVIEAIEHQMEALLGRCGFGSEMRRWYSDERRSYFWHIRARDTSLIPNRHVSQAEPAELRRLAVEEQHKQPHAHALPE